MPAVPPCSSVTTAICRPLRPQLGQQRRRRSSSPARAIGANIRSAAVTAVPLLQGYAERPLDVHEARDVVGALVDHRHPREAGAGREGDHVGGGGSRGRPTSSARVGSSRRRRRTAENRRVRSSRVASSASSSPAVAECRIRKLSSSALRAPAQLLLRLDAHRADQAVGGVVEEHDHRLEHGGEQRPGTAPRPWRSASGRASAKFFGTSSPITIENSGRQQHADDRPDRRHRALGHPEPAERGLEQRADRRLEGVAGEQRRQGDPELRAREVRRGDPEGTDRGAEPLLAAVATLLQVVAVEVDQRELGGHEQPGADGEDQADRRASPTRSSGPPPGCSRAREHCARGVGTSRSVIHAPERSDRPMARKVDGKADDPGPWGPGSSRRPLGRHTAVAEGFEPSVGSHQQTLSRRSP